MVALGWAFVALSCATLIWYVEHLRRQSVPFGDAVGSGAAGIVFLVAPSLGVVLVGVVTRVAAGFWGGQAGRRTGPRTSSPPSVRPA